MKITLKRKSLTAECTIGALYIDGVFECYTLEDTVREVKIAGVTAIPKGIYRVIINISNRFKRLLPLLLDVPGFEGVRIHPGNTAKDTEGCILVGTSELNGSSIGSSRVAFDALFAKMQAAKSITLTVE